MQQGFAAAERDRDARREGRHVDGLAGAAAELADAQHGAAAVDRHTARSGHDAGKAERDVGGGLRRGRLGRLLGRGRGRGNRRSRGRRRRLGLLQAVRHLDQLESRLFKRLGELDFDS